ncbi:hypothetical protein CIB48_g9638 [Xylaria polymorpha]|nr:hypothetical protein CIB48_g9638 [Xylaria polymorpha]
MAAPRDRPYRHLGVFIPFSAVSDDDQWSSEANIERDGFIYQDLLGPHIFSVQSVSTGDLFVNKIVLPGILYNGGCLEDFVAAYRRHDREIPEHFIWHVLLTLIEAVRYLKFGALPGTDDEDPNWIRMLFCTTNHTASQIADAVLKAIHHRDIAGRNGLEVFIHYLPRDDPEPEEGFEENAFPELILGDFGHAAMNGDALAMVQPGCWDEPSVIAEWHIFSTAKELCTQVEHGSIENVNVLLGGNEQPYSDDLIQMFQHFEYPNYDQERDIRDSQLDPVSGLMVPNHSLIPNMRRVVDEFLPIIRDRVQRYRNPAGGIPNDGGVQQLDVSWTKPDPFMPYEWMTQGLSNTNSAEDEDKNKGKDKEDGENDSDRENQNPNAQPVDEHVCVKPNPVSVRKLLEEIIELEKGYPDERPAHQIVHLDYGQPIMTEIRQPPPPPAPAMPGPLPPTQ